MKITLGKKRVCTECGNKFYDLGEFEPICTKCGHIHAAEVETDHETVTVNLSILNHLMQDRADKMAAREMRYVRGGSMENLDELSTMDDDIREEDHQHFDIESDGDAAEYMDMNVRNASIVDDIDDDSGDSEERAFRG